ncbi:kunitz-type protease inhibitor 4 isoform X3 [Oxyura jamaicensis]|uniref:kunitz-type protease inhibitor 4 isoform X3 n=1 Tax=Oxyura jamaicensis TaxID=8884 RepID=UPI0015A64F9B|nr:kunitz-type protease inhibitor 4 isoform X3 [Oxyura jamaicensis]
MALRACLLLLLLVALSPLFAQCGPTPRVPGRSEPAMGTEKPGYCYHIPEVENLLDKDCSSCRKDTSCSRCAGDADCPGATKCCPSKCGYTCQEPVLDFCYLPSVCGNCKALFIRFFYNASSQRCEEFIYGGCGGNRNNFETRRECFQACSHAGNQPHRQGPPPGSGAAAAPRGDAQPGPAADPAPFSPRGPVAPPRLRPAPARQTLLPVGTAPSLSPQGAVPRGAGGRRCCCPWWLCWGPWFALGHLPARGQGRGACSSLASPPVPPSSSSSSCPAWRSPARPLGL